MEINKIAVIGTGTMGAGIVQAFAQAGRKVTMKSRSQASNDKAFGKITKSLSKLVEKGKMAQADMDAVVANITLTTEYNDIADADLIIEAAVEEMDLKIELFKMLDLRRSYHQVFMVLLYLTLLREWKRMLLRIVLCNILSCI